MNGVRVAVLVTPGTGANTSRAAIGEKYSGLGRLSKQSPLCESCQPAQVQPLVRCSVVAALGIVEGSDELALTEFRLAHDRSYLAPRWLLARLLHHALAAV